MFIGRKQELETLQELYADKKSALVVVYGRRRVGKTALIERFTKGSPHFYFEGLEKKSTRVQITRFKDQLALQIKSQLLAEVSITKWHLLFEEITTQIKNSDKKLIITFDEFQWMAAGRVELVSLIKHYWDTQWKNYPCLILLCGSIASFMVNKVIKSKSLYGRISKTIRVIPLGLNESAQMLTKRSSIEVVDYLMIFGAIPKYLEEINQSKSFEKNIQDLCFNSQGFFFDEMMKIFFSQFKEAKTYQRIAIALSNGPLKFQALAKKLNKSASGSFKSYIDNLEAAGFVSEVNTILKQSNKTKSYKLTDPFLVFYFKYIKQLHRQIAKNTQNNFFSKLILPTWQSWRGIAFENLCRQNALEIARFMKFDQEVIDVAPFSQMKTKNKFQIDLIYKRYDSLYTVCEIKFHNKEITTAIIPEVERKIELLKEQGIKKIEKMLITNNHPSQELRDSGYFHHIVNIYDVIENK